MINQSLEITLNKIVNSVQAIGYDRVRLYLLTQDRQFMECLAQTGMPGWFGGTRRPAAADPYLQELLEAKRPLLFQPRPGWVTPFDNYGAGSAGCPTEWVCIPLLSQGQVIGKLSVDNYYTGRPLEVEELIGAAHFATQAVTAIEAARWAQTLENFNRVAAAISSTLELDEILRRTCQAAQELFQVSHSGMVLFADDYSYGTVKAEYPLALGTLGLRLPLQGVAVEEALVNDKTPIIIEDLPTQWPAGELRDILAGLGIQSVLIVPMVSRGKLIGSLSLDSIGAQRRFSAEEISLCQTLAMHVALAIENAQRFQEIQQQLTLTTKAKGHLELAMQAGQLSTQADNLTEALQKLARLVVTSLGGTYCRLSFITEDGLGLSGAAAHAASQNLQWTPRIGETCANQMMPGFERLLTAEPSQVQVGNGGQGGNDSAAGGGAGGDDGGNDGSNDEGAEEGEGAARPEREPLADLASWSRFLGLPKPLQALLLVGIRIEERMVGVLELGELRRHERFWLSEEQIKVATAIAAQIALLVDRLQQLDAAQSSARAVEAMAAAFSLPQALEVIASQARSLFGAQAAVVWGYDGERHKFLTGAVKADGLTPQQFVALCGLELAPGVITNTILREGEVVVDELAESDLPPAGVPVRAWLEAAGIRSYCGIKLQVDDIVTGFLYLCYATPRTYSESELQRYRYFAIFAALALRKAALLEQMSAVKRLAGTVMGVLTAGNVTRTLQLIVEEGRRVLGCDAMTLYAFDEPKGELVQVPTTSGLDFPELTAILPKVAERSIIYQMLNRGDSCIVPCVALDERFKERRFTLDERIKSLVARPLRVQGRRTGVIFFNYRTERRFTEDELGNIEMFADLAGLAVHNAQLQEERAADLSKQVLLAYLSQEFLNATTQQEILNRAVEVARSVLQTDLASIVLTDSEGHLLTVATAGWAVEIAGRLRPGDGLNSHAGYTIQYKLPVRVLDYNAERRFYPPAIVFEQEICSGMSAPLTLADGITGALLVQSRRHHEFSNEEETLLRLLADETSIAIKSLQKDKALEVIQNKAAANAELARAGITSSTLAHEIFNSMGLVRIQLEALFDSKAGERLIPAWMDHYLEIIEAETLRLIELSKLPSADEGLEKIKLNAFIKDFLNTLKKSELYRGLELKPICLADGEPVILANPRWLKVVLENLLKNAAHEISKPDVACHSIIVQVQIKEPHAQILVIDGGQGIPPNVQDSFRLGHKATQREAGLGIGLLKARFITEIYGGSIEISETGPHGTKMLIRLPLAQVVSTLANQAAASTHAAPGIVPGA